MRRTWHPIELVVLRETLLAKNISKDFILIHIFRYYNGRFSLQSLNLGDSDLHN
jgi:hypothetical protein